MDAKRDDNRVTVGLAWDGTTTQPLKVDSVTGRLLIAVMSSCSAIPIVNSQPAKRDDNRESVSLAIGDDATAAVIPLHLCAESGYLSVDLSS